MSFDPSKPVRTRDGRPARIVCGNRKDQDGANLVVLIPMAGVPEYEFIITCRADGSAAGVSQDTKSDYDLINVDPAEELENTQQASGAKKRHIPAGHREALELALVSGITGVGSVHSAGGQSAREFLDALLGTDE